MSPAAAAAAAIRLDVSAALAEPRSIYGYSSANKTVYIDD